MSLINTMQNLLTQETCPKKLYLTALYALLQRQAPEYGLRDEPMIGTLYYEHEEEEEGTFTYPNIGIAQYLGGVDFPENDDVRLQVVKVDPNGNMISMKEEAFFLSFRMKDDAENYFARVQAHRKGV